MGSIDTVPFPGELCFFPILNAVSGEKRELVESVPVNLDFQTKIQTCREAQGLEIPQLLQASWAVMLSAYTRSKYPSFSYADDQNGRLLCSVDLSENREMSSLADRLAVYEDSTVEDAKGWVNSAVTWNSPGTAGCLNQTLVSLDARSEEQSACRAILRYRSPFVTRDQAMNLADLISHIIKQFLHGTKWTDLDLCSPRSLEWLYQRYSPPEHVEECVHDLILKQCQARPDADAVCAWDGELTYGALEHLSCRLAEHLVRHGVGPETFVALYFEKSQYVVVALLAVMRAGGAFLLLEPSFPTSRLQGMCRQLNIKLALSATHLTESAAHLVPNVIPVGMQSPWFQSPPCFPATLSAAKVEPRNALYAVYTSGSTGVPKGVVNIHSAACSGQKAFADIYQIDRTSRVFQFSSFAFDASILEILNTLMAGACLCIPSESSRRSNITDAIVNLRANYLQLTPTVSRLLRPIEVPLVKTLVLVGEPMLHSDITTWATRGVRVLNGYGPAECCVSTCIHPMNDEEDNRVIGSTSSALCWIVEPANHHKLAPVGAVGELLVDGPTVGRGYVDDPTMTANSFVPSPVWRKSFAGAGAKPAARMYKTGDLAQYVADGKIRYLGRKDAQVKIFGQRLELSEVEHHVRDGIAGDCEVAAEVITPADSDSQHPILAAFAVSSSQWSSSKEDRDRGDLFAPPSEDFRGVAEVVLAQLKDRIPAYMVPSVLIPLKTMPTTNSGKLDRRRLRELSSQMTRKQLEAFIREAGATQYRAPASPMETILCGLIAKLLHVKEKDIGMNDNFYSLGGDSIRAMQLVQMAREEAGVHISGIDVVRAPTLVDLALTMRPWSSKATAESSGLKLLRNDKEKEKSLLLAQKECGLASTAEIEDVYPCTPLQEGMIALSLTSPRVKYAMQSVFPIPRAIDSGRLKDAWDTIISCSPVLRTRIIQCDGQALQVVVKGDVEWNHTDNLEIYVDQNIETGFRLGEPLIRLAIAETGSLRHFVLTIHHALYDGSSLPKLYMQVEDAYYGVDINRLTPFSLFIDHLLELDTDKADAFWQLKLAGFSAPSFPSTHAVANRSTEIKSMRHKMAIAQPKAGKVTTSAIIKLAWALTISQYSGTDDVVFGQTLAGRNVDVPGIDNILGPTMTTVPVRIQIRRAARVQDILHSVQQDIVATIPFEHVGLQRIASLGPDAALACQFQNMLIIQPPKEETASTIFNSPVDEYSTEIVDNYPLMVEACLEKDGSVCFKASYNSNVIACSVMRGMLDHLAHNVLQLMESTADTTIKDLMPTTSSDFDTIKNWNNHVPQAIDGCVHDVIRRHCMSSPNSTAVVAWDGTISYSQLAEHSTVMAAHLVKLGICPGKFVMIHLGRSLWTIIAMVAVMQAGGAFVLLESRQPVARLQHLCRETQASLVITSNQFSSDHLGPEVLNIDDSQNNWQSDQKVISAESTVGPHDPVYVVFTSGSTGRPKGVVVQHAAFLTSAIMNGGRFQIGSDTRMLHCSSLAFDASIAEILYSLVHGACVCIPTEADCRNNLTKAINDYAVTCATLTPSVARTLDPSKQPTLRVLLLGGEALASVDIQMWAGRLHLANGYGPTECCVDALVQPNVTGDSDASNIGWGVAVASWIVDPEDVGILKPIGAVGELLLEGPTLAQGYLHDPEKTAASFTAYPDWLRGLRYGKPGRLYRTGDLVRYSPKGDGSLLYVGRRDNQVKLRGQRIELGEVEQHVRQAFSNAREVVADIVRPSDAPAQPTLTAFVLAGDSNSTTANDSTLWISASDTLRAQIQEVEATLQSLIAHYMVPAVFLPLSRIPFTISGKVDRRLLRQEASKLSRRELRSFTSGNSTKEASPSTPAEFALQNAVSTVLQLPATEIEMQDHFFRLGGDSILAMKLVGLLRASGFRLTVAEIFDYPRISDLARLVQNKEDLSPTQFKSIAPFSLLDDSSRAVIFGTVVAQCRVDSGNVEDVYPCTPMQEGLLALSMLGRQDYIGRFAFDVPKGTNIQYLRYAWQAVCDANPILRTRVVQAQSGLYQAVLRLPASWSEDLKPLQIIYGGSLYKICILQHDDHFRLHLWMHHCLYDGVSMSGLLQQVQAAYNGNVLDFRPFSPFVAYIKSLDSTACARFWKSQFSDIDTAAIFPDITAHPPDVAARESLSTTVSLPDISDSQFTLPCKIQLACTVVFGHWGLSNDVIYGLTLAGRNAPVDGVDKISGPTITTIPFRYKLRLENRIQTCLQEIQGRLVEMIPYEQMGLQHIRSMNSETEIACNFRSQVIIELEDEDTSGEDPWLREIPLEDDEYSQFTVHLTSNFETGSLSSNEVTAVLGQLSHVLKQIVQNQNQSLAELELISPLDWSRLAELNATVPSNSDRLVHDMIFESCKRQPAKTAIDSWDGSLSYHELVVASFQFAQSLSSRGVGPQQVTAVCMEKSRWTVVAILAVLKTGSACMMIDPSHPTTRMQTMMEQTSAQFVVVSPLTKGLLADLSPSVVVLSPFELNESHVVQFLSVQEADPKSPAIIHFTSGSTGHPKGIVLEHTNISTAMPELLNATKLRQSDRVLHFGSYAFDASFMEVFGSLLAGACLCIPSDQDRMSNIAGFIRQSEVTWATMIPSTTSLLLTPSDVPCLRTLVLVGEPVSTSVSNQWAGRLCLINGYGPAECTIITAAGQIPAAGWSPGTIGHTVNCIGWITSISNPEQLAALGAPGELLIEGPILARGYLGNPEQTAASFISSPAWLTRLRGHDKSRLYRTGDIVRYNQTGELKYIRRQDTQVKLNGQRIELTEIESHLSPLYPARTTVVVEKVTPRRFGGLRPRLCVFVYLSGRQRQSSDDAADIPVFAEFDVDFRRLSAAAATHLSRSLPHYMVPRTYIPLNQVPLTGSGKINRRLLRELAGAPDSDNLDGFLVRSGENRAPSTETEKKLVDIWAGVLGIAVGEISASDDFFHVGGDSIMAMKLAAEVRRHGMNLSVRHISAHPILSDMASVAETGRILGSPLPACISPFALLGNSVKESVTDAAVRQCSVASEKIEDAYPCTPLQEGLVSLSMRNPGAFVGTFKFSLSEDIDLLRFRKAWQDVANANPIMRTRIIQNSNAMFQIVLCGDISWTIVDNMNEYDVFSKQCGMHLGQSLIHLAHEKQRPGHRTTFVLIMHHAIYDGWSLQLILDQVYQAYNSSSLAIRPFNTFIGYLARSNGQTAQDYWANQLAEFEGTSFPSLPSSGYQPTAHSTITETIPLNPPAGITKATLLQLAWSLALSRYADIKDVVFGLTLSGRQADVPRIESITGPTITTVPLRVRLQSADELPVVSMLRQVQEQMSSMLPFEQLGLQNIRRLGADAAVACDFQNLLLIQPGPSGISTTDRDKLLLPDDHQRRGAESFSTYALEVTCETAADKTTITFDFDPRALKPEQARRILSCYTHLVQQMQHNPSMQVSELDFVSPSARREITKWNAVLPAAENQRVHDGIQQQCLKSLDAPAVCAWDGDLTYKELDHLSSELALHLHGGFGIGPEIFVPICSEKSRWVAVAILGVIKAGGAILLLDPKIPFERLRTICDIVSAKTIVSSRSCAHLVSKLATSAVVIVGPDTFPKSRQGNPQICPSSESTPQSALYAIFTSGSTGKPKGIVIDHTAFYTSGRAQERHLYLDSTSRTLQFASHMFDVSVADYLWTFLTGGCVCIPLEDTLKNDLPGVVNELQVNRIDMTPSIARVYSPEDMPSIKTILLGGEPMSQVDVQKWAGKVRLVNGYGPSECSVCCILADVDADSDPSIIGHVHGAVAWIVDKDDHNHLVPPGAPGELLLEGHTLARGYLGEPQKTAAAFIDSPPWLRELRPSSRLYKTGDLVQYAADGTVRYIGRKDTQVKIRGQRVELGEIEHQIHQASSSVLHDVVVELLATGDGQAGSALVAFVCESSSKTGLKGTEKTSMFVYANPEWRAKSQILVHALSKRLPSYMIPSIFIPLSYVPISPSGKTDRRLLREQAATLPRKELETYLTRHIAHRPPETESEQTLQNVVAGVLHLEPSEVGMDDDFLQLGGDSIIAIRLVSRAQEAGFSFRVTDIFRSPKLYELALMRSAGNDTTKGADDAVGAVSSMHYLGFADRDSMIETVLSSGSYSFSKDNVREILPVPEAAQRMLLQPPEYWALNLEGPIDFNRLQWACTELVHRHEILRTTFVSFQSRFVQVILDRIDTNIQHLGLRTNLDGVVDQHRREDPISVPTIDHPVTRFTYIQGEHDKQVLVLRLSHAQFDGYSLHTLWYDLKCLYERTRLPPAAKLSSHIQQWIKAQHQEEAFRYWERVLDGSTVTRINDAVFAGDDNSPYTTHCRESSHLITASYRAHLGTAIPHSITQATLSKAAWAFLLARLTGTESVVFAQISNGRNYASPDAHHLVNMSLNQIPVRVSLDPAWTALELMQFVQNQHCTSMPYELVDFSQIVNQATAWPRGTTHQSNFLHQNVDPDEPFSFGSARALVTCSYDWPQPPDEILVESRPLPDGELQLTMDVPSVVLSQANADLVMQMLAQLVEAFSNTPHESLSRLGAVV
ncbi:nonribosomal peptide synthetase fmqA [Aspergillus undulatus]|uniref:nonribosomal peptide synthetase fmqA n=1 Tax=Aspergillus undulatus TaxID=1810928 RepID=UPI003CCCA1E6